MVPSYHCTYHSCGQQLYIFAEWPHVFYIYFDYEAALMPRKIFYATVFYPLLFSTCVLFKWQPLIVFSFTVCWEFSGFILNLTTLKYLFESLCRRHEQERTTQKAMETRITKG